MKSFVGFVRKEFYHILRDFRTMILLFGMPVAQILIFGFVVRNEIRNVNIAVLDYSKDETTREITQKILSSGYFSLYRNLQDENEIQQVFKQGKVKEVLLFEDNFGQHLKQTGQAKMQIITDASDPNSASLVVNYTRGIVANYLKNLNSQIHIPLNINPVTKFMFNPALKSVFMFVPGTIALILMLVSAMMTSISIAREKETGTMEALLVSPLRPTVIIIGKVTPYVLLSFINAVVIVSMGYFVFKLPVHGSLVLLMAENVLFILLALSLGILISTVSSSQQVAMFISLFALMLPTILLSGFIFPIENMPKILQWLSIIMPPRWFLIIIKNIMIKGTGFLYVWKETLVLIGMTTLFLVISARKFKLRLE